MKTNRLSTERSPYLLQHQYNPVEWYPWGEEAFAKARREQKLIFLSVGYSTCHWCHVMEHESFENEAIAAILNAHFVSIKVDREERPDIDRIYMTFVQAATGSGGWPMSVFLTPDLNPLLGGTYYPPVDRWGKPGFGTVLRRLEDAWQQDRDRLLMHSREAATNLQEYAAPPTEIGASALQPAILEGGYEQIAHSYEPDLGGFSHAPKFPRPVTLNFLLRYSRVATGEKSDHAREMVLHTLQKMAQGGMYDHLGGGFHRYSVDRYWHVPHFEKMLYDQAQLACSYLEAYQLTSDLRYASIAHGILGYVQRDMTSPEGGFYSAEDADSLIPEKPTEKAEGAFYIWSEAEINAALPTADAEIFKQYYGVILEGNSPEGSDPHGELTGKNTLIQRYEDESALATTLSISENEVRNSLANSKHTLFSLRSKRPHPHLDDKIITAWNGLMISAFARASTIIPSHRDSYLSSARSAADFALERLCIDGDTLLRSYRQGPGHTHGFADDYAYLIQGLLDLYEACGSIAYLQSAQRLQQSQDRQFLDREHGGYYSTAKDAPNLILRVKDDYDGAEPSANSVSALNLLRLSQLLQSDAYRTQAEEALGAFTAQLARMPSAIPQMLVALDQALANPVQILLLGTDTQPLQDALHSSFIPHKTVLHLHDQASKEWLGNLHASIRALPTPESAAAAYLCRDFTCQAPVSTPEALKELLKTF